MSTTIYKFKNGKHIQYELINARQASLKTNGILTHTKLRSGINSIIGENIEYKLNLEDTIELDFGDKKIPFNVQHISFKNGAYTISCEKRTKASYFLLPMLGMDESWFKWNTYFINAKIDSSSPKLIHLVYRYSNTDVYREFEDKLKRHTLFFKAEDIDPYTVVYSFIIREEHRYIVDEFKNGKYSKFKNDYKKKILKFHGFKRNDELGQILYKCSNRKETLEKELNVIIPDNVDLWDIPDESIEYLR